MSFDAVLFELGKRSREFKPNELLRNFPEKFHLSYVKILNMYLLSLDKLLGLFVNIGEATFHDISDFQLEGFGVFQKRQLFSSR